MKDVFEQDYSALHSKGNPYRYRSEIITLVDLISMSPKRMATLTDGLLAQLPDLTRDGALMRLEQDLNTIRTVFINIHKLIEGMERYRSSMTRRMNEAVRYSCRSTADIGNRIGNLVAELSKDNKDDLYPAHIVDDHYLSVDRLYEPRRKGEIAEATEIKLTPPPIEQIALDRALDVYLRRRGINAIRLERYVEQAMGQQITLTTEDLPIDDLDGLLAFLELRSLINYTTHKDCPYRRFLTNFRVDVVEGEQTVNPYFTAPRLSISRREAV